MAGVLYAIPTPLGGTVADALLAALLETCAPGTILCTATDLTLPSESVKTRSVTDWRKRQQPIGKRPTVFLLLAK